MQIKSIIRLGLIALLAAAFTGCKTAEYKNLNEMNQAWITADTNGPKEYKAVGDTKIDGIAGPFVKQAVQLRLDVAKADASQSASPLVKLLGDANTSDFQQAYDKLSPENKLLIDEYMKSKGAADQGAMNTLLAQVTDLATAGVKTAADLQSAAKGNAGGAVDTLFKAASGPGADAVKQVNAAVKFCPVAEAMIKQYNQTWDAALKASKNNMAKAAAGK
jgi:hypothetical protein